MSIVFQPKGDKRPSSVTVKTPPRLCLAVGDNGLLTAVTNELLVLALHCHSGHRTPRLAAALITSTSRHTSGRRIAEIPDQSRPLIISSIAFLFHLLCSMQYDSWQQSFICEMCLNTWTEITPIILSSAVDVKSGKHLLYFVWLGLYNISIVLWRLLMENSPIVNLPLRINHWNQHEI